MAIKKTLRKLREYIILEVTPRIELGNRGFADLGLTAWLCHRYVIKKMERKTRLELATPTLARWCSTNWAISASCWRKRKMATRRGLEPLTSAVTGRHSNQLNYRAVILFSHLRDNNWNYSEYKAHCQHFFKKILKPKKNDSEHKSLTVIPAFTTH